MKPSIFFPEKMERIEITCPIRSASYCIRRLAERGCVQIEDCNFGQQAINKRYQDQYMQCEEAERSLRYIETQLERYHLLEEPPSFSEYHQRAQGFGEFALNDVLEQIHEYDNQLHEKVNIYTQLQQQSRHLTRKRDALRFYRPIMEQETSQRERALGDDHGSTIEMGFLGNASIIHSVTGYCPNANVRRLIASACRATRRNVAYHVGVSDGEFTQYTLFVSSPDMLAMLARICESFCPDVFEFSSHPEELMRLEGELNSEIEQLEAVDRQTREINDTFMRDLASNFWTWRLFIAREKQIFMTVDYGDFEMRDDAVVYKGWIPLRFSPELPALLEQATNESGSPVPIQSQSTPAEKVMDLGPPTFIETNEFNSTFQLLNDSYGVPSYDEINGGAFYGMYPFLFGIMFGDMGHSLFFLMATAAIFIFERILKKRGQKTDPTFQAIFEFKWLLLFLSVCAFYCGILYNECFGLPIYMFKPGWKKSPNPIIPDVTEYERIGNYVYPMGIDPTWVFKDNELVFLNSYKMKLAVIMGMSQMVFGMILQLINHIHRKDWKDILMGWIPEMLYLIPFFGYLVFAIIKKWATDFSTGDWDPEVRNHGVNLIQMQIAMILSFGKKDKTLELYPQQWTVMEVIVIVFICSIPLLLFTKPIYQCFKLHGTPEFNVLEIFVMNLIHVIEFCLSALSHIASYLRLWALSLAHSELSHVLYDELFVLSLNMHNIPIIFVAFAGFAVMTVAILLGMESFSALLHAIRLMWVEFSSKFYGGLGTAFKPVSLKNHLEEIGVR